jgi:hypothetical protein
LKPARSEASGRRSSPCARCCVMLATIGKQGCCGALLNNDARMDARGPLGLQNVFKSYRAHFTGPLRGALTNKSGNPVGRRGTRTLATVLGERADAKPPLRAAARLVRDESGSNAAATRVRSTLAAAATAAAAAAAARRSSACNPAHCVRLAAGGEHAAGRTRCSHCPARAARQHCRTDAFHVRAAPLSATAPPQPCGR